MPKQKLNPRSRAKRAKLSTELRILQLVIVTVLFAFAFTILGFIIQVTAPNQNKTVINIPEVVLTQADLLINTNPWRTYYTNGLSFKYPQDWLAQEKAKNFGPKFGTGIFFSAEKNDTKGITLFVVPKTTPGSWISTNFTPGFLERAKQVSLINIGGISVTKVINLPHVQENELAFISKNNTTYILYVRGGEQEIRIFENLLKTIKFS
jgi:hypothetical protein